MICQGVNVMCELKINKRIFYHIQLIDVQMKRNRIHLLILLLNSYLKMPLDMKMKLANDTTLDSPHKVS